MGFSGVKSHLATKMIFNYLDKDGSGTLQGNEAFGLFQNYGGGYNQMQQYGGVYGQMPQYGAGYNQMPQYGTGYNQMQQYGTGYGGGYY